MYDTPDDGERDGSESGADGAPIDDGPSGEAEWSLVAQRPYEPESAGELTTTVVSAIADAEGV